MSGSESDEPSYEVEEVRDSTGRPPNREFLVKWKGYDDSHNSWEPEENLCHLFIVQEYVRKKNLDPIYDPEEEEERKRAEKEKDKLKRKEKEKVKEEANKMKKESSAVMSDEEVQRRWLEELERRKAARNNKADKSERRAEKQLSTKEQKLTEKLKDEAMTKQLESEGLKGFELYKEKCRRKEAEENGGISVSMPTATKGKTLSRSGYSSEEEISVTRPPKQKPVREQSPVNNDGKSTRDSSPEILAAKPAALSRPRLESTVSSSSSSDAAPGPVGSNKAMAASAARQPVKTQDSSPEISDGENRKTKDMPTAVVEDEDDNEGGEPTYAVQRVLDVRGSAPYREFFVQWQGYDSEDDTWEPEEGVGHLLVVQKFIADRAAGKVPSSYAKNKKRDYSGNDEERTRKKEKDGKYGYSNFFNRQSTEGLSKQSMPTKSSSYGYPSRGGKAAGDIYDEGAPDPHSVYTNENGEKVKNFLASSFRIPKAKGGDGNADSSVEVTAEENGGADGFGEYANDQEIREGVPNDDVAMAKMVLGQQINTTDRDKKPQKLMTKILDDDQIDSITRPVDDSRFEDLYKRLQYLRIKSTSKFSPEAKIPPVTATTHIFETAIPQLEAQSWHRAGRTREVIGNYVDYFKKDLLPPYLKATKGEKINGVELLRFEHKEMPLYIRAQLKDPDVMRHLGRDVMNYEKEKSRAQTQRCVKMIQSPRIPVS